MLPNSNYATWHFWQEETYICWKKIWSLSYGTVESQEVYKRREPPTYFDVSPADRAACELHSGALRRFLQRQPAASQNSLASLSELFCESASGLSWGWSLLIVENQTYRLDTQPDVANIILLAYFWTLKSKSASKSDAFVRIRKT